MNRSSRWFRGVVVLLLVAWAEGLLPSEWVAPARADAPSVEEARSAYSQALWLKVVELLQPAVENGSLKDKDRASAMELLARAQVRLGDNDKAIGYFHQLLDQDPGWRPDKDRFPSMEAKVFEDALTSWKPQPSTNPVPAAAPPPTPNPTPSPPPVPASQTSTISTPTKSQSWYKNKWVIGGAAVVGAALAIFLSGGSGGGGHTADPGPNPPPPPSIIHGGRR